MNAFRFSDNLPTIKLSEFEKNNFSNMQMLKSIYDDSFDVANDFFRNGMEGFKSSAKKAYEKSKDSAKKSAKEAKKADKAVKDSAKKVNDAQKKVDAAKQDAAQKVEDAKQEVEEAKEEQQEAKEEAQEAKEEAKEAQDAADDAEEVATVAEGDEGAEGDEEGFDNYSDSDEEGSIEGMKSKKKSSKKKSSKKKSSKKKSSKKKSSKKYPETIPSPDLIGWAVQKANGTKNDEKLVKSILNSLFVTFLSFLIAHNWYYNFFVNPTKFRLEESLSFLKENEFIHFFTIYTVQIITSIENFIMENIPGKINFMIKFTPLGKRSSFILFYQHPLRQCPTF